MDTWEYRNEVDGVTARVTKTQLGSYDVDVIDLDTGLLVGTKRFKLADTADTYARKCALIGPELS